MTIRFLVSQDDDADAHQHESEQCSDVRQVNHLIDAHHRREPADDHTGHDGRHVRGLESRMDLGKDRWQQTIAGHGKEDARLTKLEHQQHGGVRYD